MVKYLSFVLFILSFQKNEAFAFKLPDIHEAAILGDTKVVLNLLPEVTDQEEINRIVGIIAGNGHADTLQAVMKYENKKALHSDQTGINLAAKYAAHFGDLDSIKYLLEHDLKNIPNPDQNGINSILIEAASYGDLNLIDYILHHNVKNISHPDQEGVDAAAAQAVITWNSDALIYLTTHLAANSPHPDAALIRDIQEELARNNMLTDNALEADSAMDSEEEGIEDNVLFHQHLIETIGQGLPAPLQHL
jgi:hypothetical protein